MLNSPTNGIGSTLLPRRLARVVSYGIKLISLILRALNYLVEATFDSWRISTLTALGAVRQSFERVVYRANDEVYGAQKWTEKIMDDINHGFTLLNLTASFIFHLASSAISTGILGLQDGLYFTDKVFGFTESSRAINAVISMVWAEITKENGFTGLLSGAIYFVILQSRSWKPYLQDIDQKLLWDVLVLETGEIIAKQAFDSVEHSADIPEIVKLMPPGYEYRISVKRTYSSVFTVDLLAGLSAAGKRSNDDGDGGARRPLIDIPPGFKVIKEKRFRQADGLGYRVMFQHKYRTKGYESGFTSIPRNVFSRAAENIMPKGSNDGTENAAGAAAPTPISTTVQQPVGHGRTAEHPPPPEQVADSNLSDSETESQEKHTEYNFDENRHNIHDEHNREQQKRLPTSDLVDGVCKYVRFSCAAYGPTFMKFMGMTKAHYRDSVLSSTEIENIRSYSFAEHTGLPLDDVIFASHIDNEAADPDGIPLVHFVAIDKAAKTVILAIRGTWGLEDILADFTFAYDQMCWNGTEGKVHSGMLKCALIMADPGKNKSIRVIGAALRKYPDFGFVACGHSLGGGVAALLVMLLSQRREKQKVQKEHYEACFVTKSTGFLPSGRPISCFSYGPPASMTNELRLATVGLVTSVVYGLDIVPCLSLGLIRDYQAVSEVVRENPRGTIYQTLKWLVSQVSVRQTPLDKRSELSNNHLWSVIKTLRSVMQAEKLLPPGNVIHVNSSSTYKTIDGRATKATRITGSIVVDAEKRFSEPILGRTVFHHSPMFYEKALCTLRETAGNK